MALLKPGSLKKLVPQTLGKTALDFVMFLAGAQGADIVAQCSIGKYGLTLDIAGDGNPALTKQRLPSLHDDACFR